MLYGHFRVMPSPFQVSQMGWEAEDAAFATDRRGTGASAAGRGFCHGQAGQGLLGQTAAGADRASIVHLLQEVVSGMERLRSQLSGH